MTIQLQGAWWVFALGCLTAIVIGTLVVVIRLRVGILRQLARLGRVNAFESTSPCLRCVFDFDSRRLVEVNQAFANHFGLKAGISASRVDAFFVAGDFEKISEVVRASSSGFAQCQMSRVDGGKAWFHLAIASHRERCGLLVELRLMEIDRYISSVEFAAAAKDRLYGLVRSLPDGLIVIDHAGAILLMSDIARRHVSELIDGSLEGRSLYELFGPQLGAEHKAFIGAFISGAGSASFAFEQPVKGAAPRWIDVHAARVTDPYSGVDAVALSIRDITHQMEIERDIRQHAAKLETTLARVAKLQNDMVSICAWTKQVQVDGRWIPVDEYLHKHLGLDVTHDISDEGLDLLSRQSGMSLGSVKQGEDPSPNIRSESQP